jgi:hypothetical protein
MMETYQFVFFVLAWLVTHLTICGIGLMIASRLK